MRRLIGWLFGAVFAFAPAVAYAYSPLFGSPVDVRTTLMLRLFGEFTDARTSFATVSAQSESPLRDAAFVVSIRERDSAAVPARHVVARSIATITSPAYVAPAMSFFTRSVQPAAEPRSRAAVSVALASAYEAAPPSLFESDSNTDAFSFTGGPVSAPATNGFLSALDASSTDTTLDQSVQVPLALRVGNLRLIAGFDAGLSSTPGSGIDNTLPDFVPAYAGVSRSSLGANLAVPVAPRLLLGMGYNTERLVAGYGVPSTLGGLDARNDTYTGNLTFLFPRLGSALSLSAQQYRYQDNVIPAEYTQLREDLNLTVKF